jgi:hypothetical protein
MSCGVVGWDPVFEYEGKTYAEMDKVEKVSRYLLSVRFVRRWRRWFVTLICGGLVEPDLASM